MGRPELRIDYENHDNVRELVDCLQNTLEGISLRFDHWDERYVSGPGMYVAVVTGPSVERFADPMGRNRWPTDRCRDVCRDLGAFFEAARDVALTRDGALVVSVDGVVQEQMVRFTDLSAADADAADAPDDEYEGWMGSRHMSALDTSRRPNVTATLTLSEETGRVTHFQGGRFDTYERSELGAEWNPDAYS